VIAKHKLSGLTVRIDNERSQHRNKAIALAMLASKLNEQMLEASRAQEAIERKQQVGSGMRGDKIRTYREQDDVVIDHRTGAKLNLRRWRKGEW
jgi:peptide chain release factor 1